MHPSFASAIHVIRLLCTACLYKLDCTVKCSVGYDGSTEKPSYFSYFLVRIQFFNSGAGAVPVSFLVNSVVMFATGSYLRKMRNTYNLVNL